MNTHGCSGEGSPGYSVKGENGTYTNKPDGVSWVGVSPDEFFSAMLRLTASILTTSIISCDLCLPLYLCVYTSSGYPVLWVQRSLALWLVEVTLAAISLTKAILMVYISTKNGLHLTRQKFQTITRTLLQQMIILMTNIICLAFVIII
ncbi:hypothetical protein RRG08_013757 [Elysia crispata]|uniref:Uncharacterized protein n=1 Tax=Elysia crispata TaxID=231223 RepID=A0AAE0ZPP7_9GAST|nr:hypothetical protein RRG08_013757 [Elysia crispata]